MQKTSHHRGERRAVHHHPAAVHHGSTAKKPRKSTAADWKQISAAMRQKWDAITDEDMKFLEHSMEALILKVQQRTGLERDTAERQLDDLIGPLALLPSAVIKPSDPSNKH